MGGAHLVVVMTVVVVAWAGEAVFKVASGAGACGSGFLAITVLSDSVCAMKCTQSELQGRNEGGRKGGRESEKAGKESEMEGDIT